MRFPTSLTLVGAVVLAALALACGGGRPAEGPPALTGRIEVDGSSTLFPLTEAVAEEFLRVHPRVRVTVGVSGTGGGFKRFLAGETDINDASRPITPQEAQRARANGIRFIELPVAYDGLSIVVNPQNTWADCVSLGELKRMWEPSAQGTITRWNQVRPDWPDAPLHLYGRTTDSGSFDYFTEAVVGEARASRGDYTANVDQNALVQGIAGDPFALGYVGLAYYLENRDKLKVVAVDAGKGCVLPSVETVQRGEYTPLSRPLFLYVSARSAQRPEVGEFVRFYLQNAGPLAQEVGFVPLSERAYRLALKRFEEGRTGSLFAGASPGARIEDLLAGEEGR